MADVWQLQEAKSKLSQLLRRAEERGPQIISRRGINAVVVLSYKDYQAMFEQQGTLLEFFRESPLVGEELDLERDRSGTREDEPWAF